MPIAKRLFKLGWLPDQDDMNGDPEGLLRMDNLTLDELGIVTLTRGTKKESSGPFPGAINNIYSRVNDLPTTNAKLRYVHCSNGSVYRNFGAGNQLTGYEIAVLNGGNPGYCAFGTGFAHNFICSGTQKIKDDGNNQWTLGIRAPLTTVTSTVAPPRLDVSGKSLSLMRSIVGVLFNSERTKFQMNEDHGFEKGFIVRIRGFKGEMWRYANNDWFVELDETGSLFSIPLDTRGWPEVEGLGEAEVQAVGTFDQWDDLAEYDGITYEKSSDYIKIAANPTSVRCVAQRGYNSPLTLDTTAFQGTPLTSSGEDLFKWNVRPGDSRKLIKIRIDYLLDPPASSVNTGSGTTEDVMNYYWFEWNNVEMEEAVPDAEAPSNVPYQTETEELVELTEATPDDTKFTPTFQQGINVWTTLTCKRSDFNRVGNDDAKGWNNVRGIKVTANFIDTQVGADVVFNDMFFEGSTAGPLTGTYVYLQVDVNNTGTYLVKSKPSPISSEVTAYNAAIQVFPQTVDFQANECWIYRAGGTLNGFYLVKKITGARNFTPAAFIDNKSDTDAILEQTEDNHIQWYLEHPPDNMVGMEGPFYDRMWYLTTNYLYPSYKRNPDGVDSRTILQVGGINNETALFITKISNDTMLVGTTNDIYEITGDASELAPGLLNINKRSLGVKQPPTNRMFAVYHGSLIYFSRDGWMMLNGSSSTPLIGGTSSLYRGIGRHGIEAIRMPIDDDPVFPVVVAKGRMWCSVEHLTQGRALFVYTFPDSLNPAQAAGWRWIRSWDDQNGRPSGNNPVSLFVEEDGTILAGTQETGDRYLRSLGTVEKTLDATVKQGFYFATIFDAGESSVRRKDSFTLKVEAGSFGDPITIQIIGIGDDTTSNPTLTFSNQVFDGKAIKYYDISALGLVKRYQLVIAGNSVLDFNLYDFKIEYDLRPEQLNFLRIPPSNYGVAGRKRIPEIPFVIDTLGKPVTFTPILDNIAQTPSVVNKVTKALFNHQFVNDVAAFDIGGTLSGNLFEFYELVTPKEIEVLPDPLKFKHIPYSNLGNGSRKRFIQYAFTIDCRGSSVTFTPLVDGAAHATQNFATNRKQTVIYTFANSTIGVDVGGTLSGSNEFEFYGIELSECISEKLPPLSQFFTIPYNNLNTTSRKRFIQFAFVIDTLGIPVTFTPLVDGNAYPTEVFTTTRKQTCIYTFATNVEGIDIGGTLSAGGDFEFYGIDLDNSVSEKLPAATQMMIIPCTNLGSSCRKRFIQYAFVMNSKGGNVTFTPSVDGIDWPSQVYNTTRKATCIYTFDTFPVGIDLCGKLESSTDFEFYNVELSDCISEKLPPVSQTLTIPFNNLGNGSRKRFIQVALVIDTRGQTVLFTPSIDGVATESVNIVTSRKQTFVHTFSDFPIGQEVGGTLASSGDFEFYGFELSECISEKLPPLTQSLTIPYTNLGTSARKKFIQFAFTIDTRGLPVTFTPKIDGVSWSTQTYNTSRKETVLYTFDTLAVGIDIGGTLVSSGDFEFYGVNLEECVSEKLPPVAQYRDIGCTNFGIAGKKKIRTWPFIIDTRGNVVQFNPTVDGVAYPPPNHQTSHKTTVFHYFSDDVYGVDFCATLSSTGDFEFYDTMKPENVETLPVGKLFDQFGPIELPKVGKLYSFRSILLAEGTSVHWKLYAEDNLIDEGDFATNPGKMDRYHIKFQKFRLAKIFRMEFSSAAPLHIVQGEIETNLSGNDTEKSRIKITKENTLQR